ncbi:MAG: YfcC family protein [Clostridia bacterium]|nr:YfcC family protein [Clostridia bacterium]
MSNPQASAQSAEQGLHLNKKTILFILAAIIGIMIFVGVLTQVVPRGEYLRDEAGTIIASDESGATTYHEIDFRLPFWKVLTAPVEVFGSSEALAGVAIIVFIVLIGGTFLILDKSGVLSYIMTSVANRFSKRKYLLLPIVILLMMALSSVVGILEESVTIVPLCVALSLALGWDSLVGLSISLVSIAFGYSAATFNPFNVVLVQSMAGLPIFSGLGYRLFVFVGVYLILTAFVLLYAKRIEASPERSIVYESDEALREKYAQTDLSVSEDPRLKKATRIFVGCISGVLLLAAASFLIQRIPTIPEGTREIVSYMPMAGMAILFTVGGLCAGSVAGTSGKALLKEFWQGAREIAPIAPLIIFVMAITFLMREGKIIDTILFHIYNGVCGFGPATALLLISLVVLAMEFFIGSGTAKAFLIMPLVLPLADMVGLTRQSIVLGFSVADGFGNILYPTSGVMLIAIGLVGVSYGKFLRYTWKLFAAEFAFCALALILAVRIGYA